MTWTLDLMTLPEMQFKIKITNMLMEVQKDIQKLKNELGSEIQLLKSTMEGIKSRLDTVEETINEIETREEEYKEVEAQRENRISKNERILRELYDQPKLNNIHIIGIPEEEEREKGIESVFEEVVAENFPNLGKDIVSQAVEIHRSPNTRDPKRTTPRHIVIKLAKIKDKDRLLKAARERNITTYKGKPIRLTSDFSAETLQARREWHDVLNAMKQKGLEPRLLNPARLSFKFEGGIKQFPDKQKLREFTSHKPITTVYF
ncbi:LINE-1 retrotransposable element ORF1 protein [Manis javanica]|nr:LINE-1 retrotransposable element ORF1 protein [Manis javanica]